MLTDMAAASESSYVYDYNINCDLVFVRDCSKGFQHCKELPPNAWEEFILLLKEEMETTLTIFHGKSLLDIMSNCECDDDDDFSNKKHCS